MSSRTASIGSGEVRKVSIESCKPSKPGSNGSGDALMQQRDGILHQHKRKVQMAHVRSAGLLMVVLSSKRNAKVEKASSNLMKSASAVASGGLSERV